MNYSYKEIYDLVESSLTSYLPESETYSKTLEEAEYYSLSAGGKRLRPCILAAVCSMLGGKVSDAIPFASALELIHTYSLIHDDLPAMDNDDMRRGKASNHKAFGEDVAILAGDGLLTRAFEIMAVETSMDPCSSKALAMKEISGSAYAMVRGQISDIKAPEKLTEEYMEYVDSNKTAALFRAAFTAGAHLAGASDLQIEEMRRAGQVYGIAFQLYDDLLDADTDECLNYAKAFGKEHTLQKIKDHLKELDDILNKYEDNKALKEICAFGDINGQI